MAAINMDELNEIMDNDSELIQECFAEFLIDYPNLISEVKAAIEQKDYDGIDAAAHKLKGTLRYLAAEKAASAAQAVENMGKQQDIEHEDELLATLETACQEVVLFIDRF